MCISYNKDVFFSAHKLQIERKCFVTQTLLYINGKCYVTQLPGGFYLFFHTLLNILLDNLLHYN